MYLYTTTLQMNDDAVSYEVHSEGERLYFKPIGNEGKYTVPLFWVRLDGGEWKPINIKDESVIKQVCDDIAAHSTDVEQAGT
jgi:hypothetical protein